MAPLLTSLFDMGHAPQPTLTVGGWNLPSYRSSVGYDILGANTQMGVYYTYYTPSMYPSSSMSVPSNYFPMDVCIYPWVFHTRRINFTVKAILFTEPIHMGATYILT